MVRNIVQTYNRRQIILEAPRNCGGADAAVDSLLALKSHTRDDRRQHPPCDQDYAPNLDSVPSSSNVNYTLPGAFWYHPSAEERLMWCGAPQRPMPAPNHSHFMMPMYSNHSPTTSTHAFHPSAYTYRPYYDYHCSMHVPHSQYAYAWPFDHPPPDNTNYYH